MRQFKDARELFQEAREAVRDIERIERDLERMEAREGIRPHRLTATRGPANRDTMAATDARIDAEAAYHARLERDWALVDLANAIVFGKQYDGSGGVDALLDGRHADALYWCYLGGMNAVGTGVLLGCSRATVWRLIRESFDLLDAYGLERVIDGTGIAVAD